MRSFLTPPTFPDDDLALAARLLHPILTTLSIIGVVFVLFAFTASPISTRSFVSGSGFLAVGLSLLWLERRGQVYLAGRLLVATLW